MRRRIAAAVETRKRSVASVPPARVARDQGRIRRVTRMTGPIRDIGREVHPPLLPGADFVFGRRDVADAGHKVAIVVPRILAVRLTSRPPRRIPVADIASVNLPVKPPPLAPIPPLPKLSRVHISRHDVIPIQTAARHRLYLHMREIKTYPQERLKT